MSGSTASAGSTSRAFLKALGIAETDEEILAMFDGAESIKNTIEKDTAHSKEEALLDLYRKLRPGEPTTVESARGLIQTLFRNPKRYDLTRVGRYKISQKYREDSPTDYRAEGLQLLRDEDIIDAIKYLVALHAGQTTMTTHTGTEVAVNTDDIDHFGNRRIRTVGELVQNQVRVGLTRLERVVRERMTTQDPDAITPQSLINIRPVTAAIKEFFGTSQLSQFMDQPNPLAGLTHRRRLSALGPGGLSRERAGFEVRDVHPSHYGRMCPIETPEGPNIGLIGSLASYARVNEFGFIETPYRKVECGQGHHQGGVPDRHRGGAIHHRPGQRPPQGGRRVPEPEGAGASRGGGGEVEYVPPKDVDYMDVSPKQIVSVSTSLIPFLEHDDANRALMGSNMQRQAVPLLTADAPLVGTGVEQRAAQDSGDMIVSPVDRRGGRGHR